MTHSDFTIMPAFDEDTLKTAIEVGIIGAVSIDTSIFDKLGRNLNAQPP